MSNICAGVVATLGAALLSADGAFLEISVIQWSDLFDKMSP
jgi:hypothetical protein